VTQGLRRMLRHMRKEWSMDFVEGAHAALAIMENKSIDVIVTDMRMPAMDGAQLLKIVRQRFPNTIRIVLSGQSEKDVVFRAIGTAHQYLSKPCDADLLRQTVMRACALRDILSSDRLKKIVSRMKSLPSLPETYLELMEEIKSEDPSLTHISKLIEKDVAMTAKILQIVNSAYFGIRRTITAPGQAVIYLGLENVSSLVLAANIFNQLGKNLKFKGFSMQGLWDHSGNVGRLAQDILKTEDVDKQDVDDALTAGLLHDCGKLIFAANLEKEYEEAILLSRERERPIFEVEKEVFGATHAEVGAYLLGIWGLPDSIVEAVAFHHHPAEYLVKGISTLTAVHVADVIVQMRSSEQEDLEDAPFDAAYLAEIGVDNQLNDWSKLGLY